MKTTLLTIAVLGLLFVAAPVAAQEPPAGAQGCSGPCEEASFACCCNGKFIGCYTSVGGCWNACEPSDSIEEAALFGPTGSAEPAGTRIAAADDLDLFLSSLGGCTSL